MEWSISLLVLVCLVLNLTAAQVAFRDPTFSTTENVGTFFVTIDRETFTNSLTVDITPSDNIQLTTDQITFNPGVNSFNVGIIVLDDNIPEPDIQATLTLSNPSEGTLGQPNTIAITIVDDDEGEVAPPSDTPAWNTWGPFSQCTVTCGGGTMFRTRTCNDQNLNDDVTCVGESQESTACNTQACFVTPSWSQWSGYTPCSVSCGGGTQTRSRTCVNENPAGGITCTPGSAQESIGCNAQECPNTVFFQEASFTTMENVWIFSVDVERTVFDKVSTVGISSSGDIELTSNRIIFPVGVAVFSVEIRVEDDSDPEPAMEASLTLSNTSQGTIGNPSTIAITILDDDGDDDDDIPPSAWGPWGTWSGCSVTCDVGDRIRTRTCIGSTDNCIGDDSQSGRCDSGEICPVWGDWGQWSECTHSCGSGLRIRSRSCNALGTGASCAGSNTDSEQCNDEICPAKCKSDVENTPYGRLRAPDDQEVGSVYVSSAVCPWYTRNEGSPIGTATCEERNNGQTFWDWDIDCGGEKTMKEQLNNVLARPVTPENAREMLEDTCSVLNNGGNDVDEQCVSNVIDILEDVVNMQLPDREITDGVIDVVDKLCLTNPDALTGPATSSGLKMIKKQLDVVDVEQEGVGAWPYRKVTDNIATEAFWASNKELCRGVYVASSSGTGVQSNHLLTRERLSSTNIDAEIQVPPEICDRFPNGARVVLDVMASDKMLPSPAIQMTNVGQNRFNRVINSPVISVSIGNEEIQKLDKPVRLLFTPLEIHSNNTQCVYWDWPSNDWSSQGCRYLGETPNWQRICECDHLTSFAVQMDIYKDPSSRDPQDINGLMILIVVACLTVLAVVLLVIGCLCFWYLRGRRRSRQVIRREDPHRYTRGSPFEKRQFAFSGYPRF